MKLADLDKEKIQAFYRRAARRHLFDRSRAVGWSSRQGQQVRFEVLDKIGPLGGARVLDVGSGLGDFYSFLSSRHENINYAGIDIVPQFVARAARRFPAAVFRQAELAELSENFDYVFASGSLNTKIRNYQDFTREQIRLMFARAKIAAGFNLLNRRRHVDNRHYAPNEPEEIFSFCRSLTGKLALIQGYLPWDFTIFLYH